MSSMSQSEPKPKASLWRDPLDTLTANGSANLNQSDKRSWSRIAGLIMVILAVLSGVASLRYSVGPDID